jgi:magnesium transporter
MLRHMAARQDLLATQLDLQRNHLIDVELRVSFLTLGVASGSLLTSMFGMNLASGLEPLGAVGFWGVTASAAIASILLLRALNRFTLATSPHGRHLVRVSQFLPSMRSISALQASGPMQWVLGSPNSSRRQTFSGLMRDLRAAEAASVTRSEFAGLWETSTGMHIRDDQVDLVFSIFDADGDGKLSVPEVAMLMGPSSESDSPIAALGFQEATRAKTDRSGQHV